MRLSKSKGGDTLCLRNIVQRKDDLLSVHIAQRIRVPPCEGGSRWFDSNYGRNAIVKIGGAFRMSKLRVQCSGSGRSVSNGFAKRALCPACGTMQDATANSRLRKHLRVMNKRDLKRI